MKYDPVGQGGGGWGKDFTYCKSSVPLEQYLLGIRVSGSQVDYLFPLIRVG